MSTEQLQRQVQLLRTISIVSLVIALAALIVAWRATDNASATRELPRSITVQELAVVDSNGVVRARLSGDVPDAVIKGRRMPRGGKAGGLIIYDATGQERGGYVTFDEPAGTALLTLDTRHGQVAYFVADPDHGVALSLWTADNLVELRADSGAARLSAMQAGDLVLQQPPLSMAEVQDFCTGLKEELAELEEVPPYAVLLSACKRRMPDAACRKCLEGFRQ